MTLAGIVSPGSFCYERTVGESTVFLMVSKLIQHVELAINEQTNVCWCWQSSAHCTDWSFIDRPGAFRNLTIRPSVCVRLMSSHPSSNVLLPCPCSGYRKSRTTVPGLRSCWSAHRWIWETTATQWRNWPRTSSAPYRLRVATSWRETSGPSNMWSALPSPR